MSFGQTPVLLCHKYSTAPSVSVLDLSFSWVFLGAAAVCLQWWFSISVDCIAYLRRFSMFFSLFFLLPLSWFFNRLFKLLSGNQLVLDLAHYRIQCWPSFFICDPFHLGMLSYVGGLPIGIFLPILALGSLLGAIVGTFLQNVLYLKSAASFHHFRMSGWQIFWGYFKSH